MFGHLRDDAGLGANFTSPIGDALFRRGLRLVLLAVIRQCAEYSVGRKTLNTAYTLAHYEGMLRLKITSSQTGDAPLGAIWNSMLRRECIGSLPGSLVLLLSAENKEVA